MPVEGGCKPSVSLLDLAHLELTCNCFLFGFFGSLTTRESSISVSQDCLYQLTTTTTLPFVTPLLPSTSVNKEDEFE